VKEGVPFSSNLRLSTLAPLIAPAKTPTLQQFAENWGLRRRFGSWQSRLLSLTWDDSSQPWSALLVFRGMNEFRISSLYDSVLQRSNSRRGHLLELCVTSPYAKVMEASSSSARGFSWKCSVASSSNIFSDVCSVWDGKLVYIVKLSEVISSLPFVKARVYFNHVILVRPVTSPNCPIPWHGSVAFVY
jgi:hypothetical protein